MYDILPFFLTFLLISIVKLIFIGVANAQRREWVVAEEAEIEADLETERSIEERVDALSAKERAISLETAERTKEEEVETESEFLSALIQAGSEMTPLELVR